MHKNYPAHASDAYAFECDGRRGPQPVAPDAKNCEAQTVMVNEPAQVTVQIWTMETTTSTLLRNYLQSSVHRLMTTTPHWTAAH